MNNRNVFIFGAGVSFDAGVPLLGGFVDCLLEIYLRSKSTAGKLTEEDKAIFREAVKVRETLDSYHGRAAFDDRNIEDILSILSSGANSGSRNEKEKFNAFVRAIARTIDLQCTVPSSQLNLADQDGGKGIYGKFWKAVIENATASGSVPVIVSLNYDLVLERSLIATICGTTWNAWDRPLPFDSLHLMYHCDSVGDRFYALKQVTFYRSHSGESVHGYVLETTTSLGQRVLSVELLKLHGSLNFPRKRLAVEQDIQQVCETPLLMPPVFVKTGERSLSKVWSRALEALRSALDVVVCGYSLPVTDTYMQYFLKAALGPNQELRRISVFDPVLAAGGNASAEMKSRYSEVFSPQVRSRIHFDPQSGSTLDFRSLVKVIESDPGRIFFLD